MKYLFSFLSILLCCIASEAQSADSLVNNSPINPDQKRVSTLKELLATRQDIADTENRARHYENVWKRNGFFNVAYNNTAIEINDPEGSAPLSYNSFLGITLQSGANHKLHKKPIANILTINLDFIPLDLSANYYKGQDTFNSDELLLPNYNNKTIFRRPWDISKLNVNYSMSLGPSLTIAPFNYIRSAKGVHFFKLNAYVHIGYAASLILLLNSTAKDVGSSQQISDKLSSTGIDFGHGMYTSFGINLSWKAIGVGFEQKGGSLDCFAINNDAYGSDHYKTTMTMSMFYLNFRF